MLAPEIFQRLGFELIKQKQNNSLGIGQRRFRAMFGVSYIHCSIIWTHIYDDLPGGACPVHLLWTLMFLKCYNTEEVNRSLIDADEKTIRKWIWIFIDQISKIRVVYNSLIFQ